MSFLRQQRAFAWQQIYYYYIRIYKGGAIFIMFKEIKKRNIRWMLVAYDAALFIAISLTMLYLHPSSNEPYTTYQIVSNTVAGLICILFGRFLMKTYQQILRYGNAVTFMRLVAADFTGFLIWFILDRAKIITGTRVIMIFAIMAVDLVAAISMRLVYVFMYLRAFDDDAVALVSRNMLRTFGGLDTDFTVNNNNNNNAGQKVRAAIVGAGRLGLSLAEDIASNPKAMYDIVCFVDQDKSKVGRSLLGLPIYDESEFLQSIAEKEEIQEVIFAMSDIDTETKARLVKLYQDCGCRIKTYDYPTFSDGEGKLQLRNFSIEEVLFRRPVAMSSDKINAFYSGKTILITGGGGSIGSEICRQLAKGTPKSIIILDIYENGAYDVQQELKLKYGNNLDIHVEIVSVTNMRGLERVYEEYKPEIIIMAAAHKHVPFMEKNCIEAVENNIFGTLNTILASEKYGAEHVIMVSTDKAVNPTNVMGATKRMCEMIAFSHAKYGSTKTTFTATRFGNVLGSAGSVIPLFKRQIESGGPVTVTDKRIIRYFMTIPEASQLVLQSGAMAKNGELFVLDMGKPVRIYELAENMIRLSGLKPGEDIEIVESGLRPGEKLYEELLIQSETLSKTDNELIFIEKDEALPLEEIDEKLFLLERAISKNSDEAVKKTLQSTISTYVPVPSDNNSEIDYAENEAALENAAASVVTGKRVLIADDAELNLDMASTILREIGFEVDKASNGREAFKLATSHEASYYDFILLDTQMPYMSGGETATAIRQCKGGDYSSVKIIAMASSVEGMEKIKSSFDAIDDCLIKPIHIDDLLKIVTSD